MIRTGQPHELFDLFTRVLQLPIAWPLETRGGVTSGGAAFGNVSIEAIRFPGQRVSEPKFVGFGFEPDGLDTALADFSRRNIRYGAPRPFHSTPGNGPRTTLWTNVTLLDLSDADRPGDAVMHIFLSEYSKTYVNVEQRRARLRHELAAVGGGPLGVQAVEEVLIGTPDLPAARSIWARVLEPVRESAPGLWRVGEGPAIRVVEARQNVLLGLAVRVASLQRATTFLQAHHMLQTDPEGVMIRSPATGDLSIRLVQGQ